MPGDLLPLGAPAAFHFERMLERAPRADCLAVEPAELPAVPRPRRPGGVDRIGAIVAKLGRDAVAIARDPAAADDDVLIAGPPVAIAILDDRRRRQPGDRLGGELAANGSDDRGEGEQARTDSKQDNPHPRFVSRPMRPVTRNVGRVEWHEFTWQLGSAGRLAALAAPLPLCPAGRECYEAGMKSEKSLFDSPDADAEAKSEARAEADVRAGRLISHSAVRRWLQSWGSAKPMPRPRVGD